MRRPKKEEEDEMPLMQGRGLEERRVGLTGEARCLIHGCG